MQIPAPVRFKELLKVYTPGFPFKEDVAALFLFTIMTHMETRYSIQYVPLQAKYLKGIHKLYGKYLVWLMRAGIIECDNHYIVGQKCIGYRLTDSYRSARRKAYRLSDTVAIRNYLKQHQRARQALKQFGRWYIMPVGGVGEPITENTVYMARPNVDMNRVDTEKAYPFSSAVLLYPPICSPKNMKWLMSRFHDFHSRAIVGDKNIDSNNSLRGSFSPLVFYDSPFLDEALRRKYPDVTPTMRYLKECLLRASFAPEWKSFLTTPSNVLGWKKRAIQDATTAIETFQQQVRSGKVRFSRNETNGRLDTGLTNLKEEMLRFLLLDGSSDLIQLDIRTSQPYFAIHLAQDEFVDQTVITEWAEVVCQHDVYEIIASELHLTRGQAKQICYRMLFSPNQSGKEQSVEYKRVFRQLFPDMHDVFVKVKARGHAVLANTLTQYETHAVLERICPRLAASKIPVLTIHDGLIVPASTADQVNAIMAEELTRFVGHPPHIYRTRLAEV